MTIASLCPSRPSRTGWRRGEKKASEQWQRDYLDWALADFSGYLTADELYDGPYCILSLVDNRTCKRLFYQVLRHDPSRDELIGFFQRFQAILQARQLQVHAITTDGARIYPGAIQAVWGALPHQVCEFHVLNDLTRASLRAVAQVRRQLAARQPSLKRGGLSAANRKLFQQRQRLQAKRHDLYAQRYLFVQRELSASERARVQHITRGLPQLRALREIMDEVYRLFDRRCRTATALGKLRRLRLRVQRFTQLSQVLKFLFTAQVEHALTFLDDRLLAPTSNAVERANRRYRKMQKSVYRVRTYDHVVERLALDLFREAALPTRADTLSLLHAARAGPPLSR